MRIYRIFTLLYFVLIASQTVGQYYDKELLVDTAKLNGKTYVNDPLYPRKYLTQEEVNALYFYNFEMIYDIVIDHVSPGEIGKCKDFEDFKVLSYEIKNNEIFNEFLPNCRFLYEYSKYNNQERVIAQYQGKYFRYEDFNYLMRETGKGDLPQIAKIKILAQWRLWIFDENIHLINMDTVEYMIPEEKYRIKDTNDSIIYKGDYNVQFEGNIEIEGKNCSYLVVFRNDKRTIHYISVFCQDGAINRKKAGVTLKYKDVYLQKKQ